ncbi:MAG: methyltransferase domain-containing protein [Pseudomonadota bacterium]
MVDDFWTRDHVEGWARQVGNYGDPFQRCLTKPFVVSSLISPQASASENSYLFYLFVNRSKQLGLHKSRETDLPEVERDWTAILNSTNRYKERKKQYEQIDLSDTFVFDLACGEGYLLRFLSRFGAKGAGFDVSGKLLTIARRRAERGGFNDLRFSEVDLDDSKTAYEFLIQEFEKAGAHGAFRKVVFVLSNALDHLENPHYVLREIREFFDHTDVEIEIIVSTLNPKFFVRYEPLRHRDSAFNAGDTINGVAATLQKYSFSWTDSKATLHARDWIDYETLFSESGFRTLFSCEPDIEAVAEVVDSKIVLPGGLEVGGDWPCAEGPFSFWRLKPRKRPCALTKKCLADLAENCGTETSIPAQFLAFLRDNIEKLERLDFNEGEQIAAPGSSCLGLHVIFDGIAEVKSGLVVKQELGPGDMFGDLEAGESFYANRYLYEVEARTSVSCIFVPFSLLSVDAVSKTIGGHLYFKMKESFNTYTPFYHKNREFRKTTHESEHVKSFDIFNIYDANPRPLRIEYLSRILVTCLSIDERRLGRPYGYPDALLWIDPFQALQWIDGKRVAALSQKSGKTVPFRVELMFLHDLGLVDSFALGGGNLASKNAVNLADSFDILIKAAFNVFLPNIVKKEADVDLSTEQLDAISRTVGTHDLNPFRGGIKSLAYKKGIGLFFENFSRNKARKLAQALLLLSVKDAERIATRVVQNLAFVHYALYSKDTRSFISVRDIAFFRRVISSSFDWPIEVVGRYEAYRHVFEHRKEQREMEDCGFREERLKCFLCAIQSYVIGHWSIGVDVDYGGPHRSIGEVSWSGYFSNQPPNN